MTLKNYKVRFEICDTTIDVTVQASSLKNAIDEIEESCHPLVYAIDDVEIDPDIKFDLKNNKISEADLQVVRGEYIMRKVKA